jgi:fructokinase
MSFNVIGVGEVLWDLLPAGPQLGGAPANFAYHVRSLGAGAHVITRVGNDERGREIIRRFESMDLSETPVQVDQAAPTGTAQVAISGDGLAHFTIQNQVAWDFIAVTAEALTAARSAHAICFGTLAQRSETSRHTIRQLVEAAPENALRVFDINLREQFYTRDVVEQSLQVANVLKLNDDELPAVAEMFGLAGSPETQIESLAHRFGLQVVALTRGAKGSLLYQEFEVPHAPSGGGAGPRRHGRWSNCKSRPVKVVDTVGAGDSFTAALVLGLVCKMDLDEINSIANEVARYVCSQPGATPPLPVEFAKRFAPALRNEKLK